MGDYARDVLVTTDWVADHLDDDAIRIVEVDENPGLYAEAHIPGSIGFDWQKDLQDQERRDFLGADGTFKKEDNMRHNYTHKGVIDSADTEIS
jgi:thiosulfate/3-mercaptopyruvate sulfurtransferase